MNSDIFSMKTRMNEALEQVRISAENIIQQADQSFRIVQEALYELKTYIISYRFRDNQEEIQFFKEVKPYFLSELLFQHELFDIESNKPFGQPKEQRNYYAKQLEIIQSFFERQQVLYAYYRSGRTDQDEHFFLRDHQHPLLLAGSSPDMDSRFCTVSSYNLGKIQAYERLSRYIHKELGTFQKNPLTINEGSNAPLLTWTDSKAGLIEILYGIYLMGSFNHSNAGLKEIATLLESVCHIDLGNYTRTFLEMGLRKKSRTPFLDRMKEMITKRMDDSYGY